MTRACIALGVLLLSASTAGAQYFGRNKVQYERFDFRILQTPHFDVYYYPEERDAVRVAAQLAERWYGRLSSALDYTFARRQPIVLYASHAHFSQTSIVPDTLGDGIGGFTDHLAGRVVLPFAAGFGETDHVLGHELVHAFQRDMLRTNGRSLALLPLWFSEGMAEYLSIGEIDANTRMWLRDAAESDTLPTIAQLDDPKWFPYRYGQALWVFLGAEYGPATAVKALKSRGKNAALRLQDATGKDAGTLSTEWHAFIRRTVSTSKREGDRARPPRVIGPEQNGGRMNVSPVLSPDGRYLVFLSERDGYSIDVYLADAASGAVIRKLVSTATDAHFDSLQFIESAGAWDATGQRFALATLRDGQPALMILDMPGGSVRQELSVPGVDQLFSPTWSPDGREIAFSALKGGLADLFVVALETGRLRALTNDLYSDLQPAWSPDGKRIVFATDRFSSSLPALMFGRHQLASLDVATGAIRRLPAASGAKSIDPHWSPDGASVYFVSDRSGVSEIYRLDLDGRVTQLTDVGTGVSGITALSPAISVGRSGWRAAASVYWRGAYEIRLFDLPDAPDAVAVPALDEEPARRLREDASASQASAEQSASRLREDASAGQASDRPYVPRLSLAQFGSPYLSAGGTAFGSFVRAGVSMAFGDMLGQQSLETAIQVGKDTTDNAFMTTYVNRRSRWNWAIAGGRIPALVGMSDSLTQDGDVATRRVELSQQIHHQVAGMIAYPFSKARRLEGSLGIDAIGFERRATATSFGPTGRVLEQVDLPGRREPGATMIQTGAALVYDTALIGPVGPVLGRRYRLALAPSFGDLHVLTAVADYRRYLMPKRPFTIALRVDGVARTGADADDPRLLPLVWNMRDLVRGYDTDNATVRTSRFLVSNAELRFPIVGALRRTVSYGPLPIEALAFADAGRFWTPSGSEILYSAGTGVRFNAAGFVFEFDAVRTMGPLSQGWRLGVNFQPGF